LKQKEISSKSVEKDKRAVHRDDDKRHLKFMVNLLSPSAIGDGERRLL
jgi:hypothetical protein